MRWAVLASFLVAVGIFASYYAHLQPVDDREIYMLQGSPSQAGLVALNAFGPAAISPLRVVVDGGAGPGGALSPAYFAAEADVIVRLRAVGGSYVDASSFTALSFLGGAPVPPYSSP
jgi:hypothetical protein